ncbi:MAG TPA: NAD(P)/FAD-dependent oxidoreductase [Candidatus Deferrimicrobium sp.]|nr:NAD(P)/FAD-dependent oxidoreductase [Candidatus Deferrimicrobium sp.]
MENSDIIIAGAGPAGCIFALSINPNISVTLVERKMLNELGHDWADEFDRNIAEGYPFLQYIESSPEAYLKKFYSPDGTGQITAPFSNRFKVDRKILAQKLVATIKTQKNIKIIENASIQEPLFKNNYVIGVKYSKDNQEQEIQAKLVVDATGFPAILRQKVIENFNMHLDLEKFDTFITFRKYIKQPETYEKREHEIFFGKYQGISWINTETGDLIDLFAGVPNFKDHVDPKQIVNELEAILQKEFGNQIDLAPIRANCYGVIPTRRCLDSFCENGFLLIGDSACQAEPLTGSGIASSMVAGYLAAMTVNNLFDSKRELSKVNLWKYNADWIHQVGARYASIDVLRLFLYSRTENDFNFLIKHRIITQEDFRNSLSGEKIKIGLIQLLQKLWRGITRLGLLLALNTAINNANKIQDIYLNYPAEFDEQAFLNWQEKKNRIFSKYYKKLHQLY